MEREFKVCPKCKEVGREVRRISRPRTYTYENGYRDSGIAEVSFIACAACGNEWHFDYIFNPNG